MKFTPKKQTNPTISFDLEDLGKGHPNEDGVYLVWGKGGLVRTSCIYHVKRGRVYENSYTLDPFGDFCSEWRWVKLVD